MGLLMESAQKDECIVLPSVHFDLSDALEASIRHLAEREPIWGRALRDYGISKGTKGFPFVKEESRDPLEIGINKCLEHFRAMNSEVWKDFDNVFTVVLAKLRHAGHEEKQEVIVIDDSDSEKIQEDDSVDNREELLLRELKEKLPYLYIHLHALDIIVDGTTIETAYWEKRLVETSQFNVAIEDSQPWSKTGTDWYRDPTAGVQSNDIRFFAGFDPYRCKEPRSVRCKEPRSVIASTLKVYTYSRASGRLIKVETDPRGDFGLNSGSTDFKQGLTIIIDDVNGTLPLNPTKQDTAFGHSEHGQLHSENLKQWTAAITHFFWTYHFEQLGKSKCALTEAVHGAKSQIDEVYGGPTPRIVPLPLCLGTFITYPNLKFDFIKHNGFCEKMRVKLKTRTEVSPLAGPTFSDDSLGDSFSLVRLNIEHGEFKIAERNSFSQNSGRAKRKADAAPGKATTKRKASTTQDEDTPTRKASATTNKLQQKIEDQQSEMEELEQERDEYAQMDVRRTAEMNVLRLKFKEKYKDATQKMSKMEEKNARYKKEVVRLREANEKLALDKQTLQRQGQRHIELQQADRMESSTVTSMPVDGRSASNSSGGDVIEMAQLKREAHIYKSRSTFYEEQTESYKKQVQELEGQKQRFEDRIRDLEQSQLGILSDEA
jgi:hypothetical protein